MNEQKIKEIKNSIRELMQVIIQRGESLSDEMKLNIAQVLEYADTRIQALRQEESEGPTEGLSPTTQELGLEQGTHPSSNINSFKYDYDTGKLLVKFQGDFPSDNGPVYSYEGVPKFIYDTFRKGAVLPKTSGQNDWHRWEKGKTPSLGAAMYHLIRSYYPYQRLS